MTKRVNETARRRLRARFWEVLARYGPTQKLMAEELETREEDVENAAELWDSRVLSTLSDADLAILADVTAALRRVAGGSYGRCEACGDAIVAARLEVIPEAARCVECARAAEPRRRTARGTA